ncbi:hypothetical protein GGR57DRAFT_501657 [Xylariaceae sp. FL1272]|nr:hypothetical protein GGR57DRAFT_501657 [Xylariaceae sp. FL1272]
MAAVGKAFNCFVGTWGILNATLTNTTSGALIPEWHSVYPSGQASYTGAGYNTFIITANDITQASVRPRQLMLPAKPCDPDSEWALVGKYSLGAAGPFTIAQEGDTPEGPAGTMLNNYTTATLPSWVGLDLTNYFQFYNECNLHSLRSYFAADLVQTVFFNRLPNTFWAAEHKCQA